MHILVGIIIGAPVLVAFTVLLVAVANAGWSALLELIVAAVFFAVDVLLAIERSVTSSPIVCRVERFITPKRFARCLIIYTLCVWLMCWFTWLIRPRNLDEYLCVSLLVPPFAAIFYGLLEVQIAYRRRTSPDNDALSLAEREVAPKRPARSARRAAD